MPLKRLQTVAALVEGKFVSIVILHPPDGAFLIRDVMWLEFTHSLEATVHFAFSLYDCTQISDTLT